MEKTDTEIVLDIRVPNYNINKHGFIYNSKVYKANCKLKFKITYFHTLKYLKIK